MKIHAEKLSGFIVVFLCVLATPFLLAEVQAKEKQTDREVLIASSSPVDIPYNPLVDLSNALQKDVKSIRFRLKWFYSAGSWSSRGEALYNRADNTLIECVINDDQNWVWRYHNLYKGVDDGIIQRASRDLGLENNGPFTFSFLSKYGATVRKLK